MLLTGIDLLARLIAIRGERTIMGDSEDTVQPPPADDEQEPAAGSAQQEPQPAAPDDDDGPIKPDNIYEG
jgi:hypothetical protein